MISLYALGRFGWLMTICFAALGAASVCVFAALVEGTASVVGRVGLGFLLGAGVGLEMAGSFPMDPVATPPAQRSLSGKMHGVAFLMGVPCQLLATLLISVAPARGPRGGAAAAACDAGVAKPHRDDRGHGEGGAEKSSGPEWAGEISGRAEPVVHDRIRAVVDRGGASGGLVASACDPDAPLDRAAAAGGRVFCRGRRGLARHAVGHPGSRSHPGSGADCASRGSR